MDEFIQQFDDHEIEVRPDPASDFQIRLAQNLSFWMREYKAHRRLELGMTGFEPRYVTRSDSRLEVALELERLVSDVRSQGMVHDGTRLKKELEECREDNRKLSLQLLEYKNRLGLKES